MLAQAQACHGQGNMQIVGGILLFCRSRFAATIIGIFGVLTVAYGRLLWNKGERMNQESIALRGLNAMLAQALACHGQGDMQGALDALSSSYATNKKLLSLEDMGTSSGRDKIMNLREYEIQLDGVAYIINLIGEALKSGKVNIPDDDSDDLIIRANRSFRNILGEELEQLAQGLDTNVEQRLKTVRHIAQMNLTTNMMNLSTLQTAERLPTKNKLADQLCKEAREGIEDYLQLKLHPMPELRLAANKDSLRVISDHVAAIKVPAVDQQSNSWPASTATQHY